MFLIYALFEKKTRFFLPLYLTFLPIYFTMNKTIKNEHMREEMLYTNYCNYNFSNPDYDIIDRPQGIAEYLFLYFHTPMRIRLNGGIYIAKPGACILIPPHTRTYYQAVEQFKNSFVHFNGDTVKELLDHYENIPRNTLFYPPDVPAINQIIKEIYTEYVSKDFLWEERIDNLLQEMLIVIARQLGTSLKVPDNARELYDVFQKARLTILTHPEQEWTAQSMAELAHLGSSQFYNYYKEFFQCSPKSELLDVRIERAKYLLQHENFSVAVVAEYCGFTNLSHFTRYFKKKCGMTPGAFRDANC